MARQPRFMPPGYIYHVINRGNNQNEIFKEGADYEYYLKLVKRFKKEHPFDLYHFCLMTNHVHKLVKINKDSNFSLFMKKINLAYFYYFKQKYGFSGHFWQGRFKSQMVSSDEYLIQCGKYIELNPVRAGLVKSPQDYSWSSYRYYFSGAKNDLIVSDIFYLSLGHDVNERRKNYQNLIVNELDFKKVDPAVAVGRRGFVYNANRKIKYHQLRRKAHYRKNPD